MNDAIKLIYIDELSVKQVTFEDLDGKTNRFNNIPNGVRDSLDLFTSFDGIVRISEEGIRR